MASQPRLQQGSNPKRNIYGSQLDNRPLWKYIDPSLSVSNSPSDDLPSICEAGGLRPVSYQPEAGLESPDRTLDEPNSWEHRSACLTQFVAGSHTAPLFLDTLNELPRFGERASVLGEQLRVGQLVAPRVEIQGDLVPGHLVAQGRYYHSFPSGRTWHLHCRLAICRWSSFRQYSSPTTPCRACYGVNPPPGKAGPNPFEPELFR